MKGTLLILAAVISCCSGQDFYNWCPNILSDMTKCSSDFLGTVAGISDLFTDPSKVMSLQTVMSDVMTTICEPSTKAVFEEFYECVFRKLFVCIPPDWRKAFPDLDKAKGSIDFICKNMNDIDVTCLASVSRSRNLKTCVQQSVTGGKPDLSTPDGFLAFTCGLYPMYTSCTQSAYGTCSKKTAAVMVEAFEYQKPIGCDACMSSPSLVLLILLIMLYVNFM